MLAILKKGGNKTERQASKSLDDLEINPVQEKCNVNTSRQGVNPKHHFRSPEKCVSIYMCPLSVLSLASPFSFPFFCL